MTWNVGGSYFESRSCDVNRPRAFAHATSSKVDAFGIQCEGKSAFSSEVSRSA